MKAQIVRLTGILTLTALLALGSGLGAGPASAEQRGDGEMEVSLAESCALDGGAPVVHGDGSVTCYFGDGSSWTCAEYLDENACGFSEGSKGKPAIGSFYGTSWVIAGIARDTTLEGVGTSPSLSGIGSYYSRPAEFMR